MSKTLIESSKKNTLIKNRFPIAQIKKRTGEVVSFDAKKITLAITKAAKETKEFDEKIAKKLTLKVLQLLEQVVSDSIPTVEDIQDCVEEILIHSTYKKTAKAYILYRDQHAKLRELTSQAQVSLMEQYLQKLDWQVKENSNMSYSLQGLHNYVASEISKIYWLNKVYPSHIRKAHTEGAFHIHDLGILSSSFIPYKEKPQEHKPFPISILS
jgi:anaerobic ribonucleoside-triphosphate reductase